MCKGRCREQEEVQITVTEDWTACLSYKRMRARTHTPPGTSKHHEEQQLGQMHRCVAICMQNHHHFMHLQRNSTGYVTLAGLQLSVHMNQAPGYQFSPTQKTSEKTHTAITHSHDHIRSHYGGKTEACFSWSTEIIYWEAFWSVSSRKFCFF